MHEHGVFVFGRFRYKSLITGRVSLPKTSSGNHQKLFRTARPSPFGTIRRASVLPQKL